jgi:poly(A) polymerase
MAGDSVKKSLLRESKILQAVYRLSQKQKEEVYLVGGTIRDLLLGRPLGGDFDFVTTGQANQLSQELAGETEGHAFSLNDAFGTWRVTLRQGKEKRDVDFSPMQGEDILEDLRQRDYTINSIGLSVSEIFASDRLALIDPLDGSSDLRQKILRANSEEALRQDPLRMLRAFRLACTLGLEIEAETLAMIQKNKNLILRSAWERMRSEFFSALNEPQSGRFLRDLHEYGLLEEMFPEMQGWESLDQGIHHDFPLLEHALRTVEAGGMIFTHCPEFYPADVQFLNRHFSSIIEDGISRRSLFIFVALFHDSGKPETRSLSPDGRLIRFFDHDLEGQRINARIARRMKLGRRSIRIISELTRQHMRILSLAKTEALTPRAKYRFFRDLGKEGFDAVFLALADGLASHKINLEWPLVQELPGDLQRIKEVAEELLRYYREEFSLKPLRPLLNGRDIMEAMKLSPGEEVGKLLELVREAEIRGTVRTKREALEFLKNLDSSRPFR